MHEKRCETCHKLEKEFVDWGFEPYCIVKPIPLTVWQWIQEFGCASWQEVEL
jgi:hypothetical protein